MDKLLTIFGQATIMMCEKLNMHGATGKQLKLLRKSVTVIARYLFRVMHICLRPPKIYDDTGKNRCLLWATVFIFSAGGENAPKNRS